MFHCKYLGLQKMHMKMFVSDIQDLLLIAFCQGSWQQVECHGYV